MESSCHVPPPKIGARDEQDGYADTRFGSYASGKRGRAARTNPWHGRRHPQSFAAGRHSSRRRRFGPGPDCHRTDRQSEAAGPSGQAGRDVIGRIPKGQHHREGDGNGGTGSRGRVASAGGRTGGLAERRLCSRRYPDRRRAAVEDRSEGLPARGRTEGRRSRQGRERP